MKSHTSVKHVHSAAHPVHPYSIQCAGSIPTAPTMLLVKQYAAECRLRARLSELLSCRRREGTGRKRVTVCLQPHMSWRRCECHQTETLRWRGLPGSTYFDAVVKGKVLQAGRPEALLQRLRHLRLLDAQALQRLLPQPAPPLIHWHLQCMLCPQLFKSQLCCRLQVLLKRASAKLHPNHPLKCGLLLNVKSAQSTTAAQSDTHVRHAFSMCGP